MAYGEKSNAFAAKNFAQASQYKAFIKQLLRVKINNSGQAAQLPDKFNFIGQETTTILHLLLKTIKAFTPGTVLKPWVNLRPFT
jgi:hypothetical protein